MKKKSEETIVRSTVIPRSTFERPRHPSIRSCRVSRQAAAITAFASLILAVVTSASAGAQEAPSLAASPFVECTAEHQGVSSVSTIVRTFDAGGDAPPRQERYVVSGSGADRCVVRIEPELERLGPAEAAAALGGFPADQSSANQASMSTLDSSAQISSRVSAPTRQLAPEQRIEASRTPEQLLRATVSRTEKTVRHRLQAPARAGDASRLIQVQEPLVFGSDDRVRVANTTAFPFNTVVYVESEFPSGDLLAYSGVMISPYAVLTSALALYQEDLGGFAVSVELAPGQTQQREGEDLLRPFGSQFATELEVPQDWFDFEATESIYGVAFITQRFPQIDRFMNLAFDLDPAGNVNMAGYDAFAQGESESFAQWTRDGQVIGSDAIFFDHRMDDDGGAIGAPVWEFVPGTAQRNLFGINCCIASDDSANVGVRLTSANEELISDWAAFKPGIIGADDPDPLDLGVADRFRVTALWQDQQDNVGTGEPVVLTADTGYFWFFDIANVEVVVKVLDGCGVNGNYWVFAAGLTDVAVELTVEDTVAGEIRTYFNDVGNPFQPVLDTSAFTTCP